MSKTKQRKDQMYYEGLKGGKGQAHLAPNRRHPLYGHYKRGLRDGRKALKEDRQNLPLVGVDEFD